MTLGQKQRLFSRLIAELVIWIYTLPGYEVTEGESWRPPEMQDIYARRGVGVRKSFHGEKLAKDLNLFIDGEYQITTSAHKLIGDKWKSMHPNCTWGGDFKRKDGNHYSMFE